MSYAEYWCVLAVLLLICEVSTGTLYLAFLAIGAAIGGIAASMGFSLNHQILAASVCAAVSVYGLWFERRRRPRVSAQENRDIHQDVGATLDINAWPDGENSLRVEYRGSQWDARLAPDAMGGAGVYTVVSIDGAVLVIRPVPAKT